MTSISSGRKLRKRHSLDLTRQLLEYNENTSLHGLKYITENGRNPIERGFWILVVILAIILGCFLTGKIVSKWLVSPVITSIESTNYSLNKVAFPAVTICPTFKGKHSKGFAHIYKTLPGDHHLFYDNKILWAEDLSNS